MKKVKRCRNPYGEGKAGQKIADILSRIEINKTLIEKKLSY
jgi:UDP-N-acetylglucosamine 2-epimerase (non-hydrolysing)/GDP/UDP-N,N'-diacetylbacillosamine 2-epimerase (hydrolysing)